MTRPVGLAGPEAPAAFVAKRSTLFNSQNLAARFARALHETGVTADQVSMGGVLLDGVSVPDVAV